jgi:sugar lactone lactonase YvrE
MAGFTLQNSPFVSPDGQTVFLSRTQNNVNTDFLYAWTDTGSALVPKWNRAVRWTTGHSVGMAADGSIYTFLAGNEFVRLDPSNGTVTATAGFLTPPMTGSENLSPHTVVDGDGRVYVGNGWAGSPASNGRVWAFDADLGAPLFTITPNRQNIGGPVLADDGTLICADLNGVRAWRSAHCDGDLNQDGAVDGADLGQLLGDWGTDGQPANSDLSGDGVVDGADLGTLLGLWGSCP